MASLRPDGWWLPAWVAGFLPALLALASVVLPAVDSSLGLVWALAAIAWGVVFVAAAELTQDPERPTLLGSRGVISKSERGDLPSYPDTGDDTGVGHDRGSATSTPRWVYVSGISAIVLILLFISCTSTAGALVATHRQRLATHDHDTFLRKFALTAQVTSSVGWLGAVAGFLVLAVGLDRANRTG